MWRRLPTTITLTGVLIVVVLYLVVWATAFADGSVRAISQHYGVPVEFRGNHGPWRHHRELRLLSEYATLLTVFGIPPAAWLGFLFERTRRAQIVAVLSGVMIVVDCAHFPLFD